jgi:tetratricopeptide (TPR) repeat protein
MTRLLILLPVLVLAAFNFPATAQRGGGGGRAGGVTMPSRPRTMVPPDLSTGTPNIFLSGKVVLDDGSDLTEGAAIQSICKGQKRTETYTDRNGNFSFEFANRPSINNSIGAGDADSATWISPGSGRLNQRNVMDCELSASLPGFTSQIIELSRVAGDQHADVGRLALHRLSQVEGLTISATSAAAPDSARKALEKGIKQAEKNKLDDAQQSFEKAVGIYSKYAVAWFELGRVQMRKSDLAGARHSFEQALLADSKYINPYRGLAQMAAAAKQWPVVIENTDKLLALNPINFPDAWLLNAVANFFLNNVDAAEKSARQGLKLDEEHHFPKFEYLLALVLIQKHVYAEAADHIRRYIVLSPNLPDIENGKKALAQIEKLDPSLAAPAIAQKK